MPASVRHHVQDTVYLPDRDFAAKAGSGCKGYSTVLAVKTKK